LTDSPKLRNVAAQMGLLAFSFLLTVALCELAIRTVAPQTVLTLAGLYVDDPDVGYRHTPNFKGRERNAEYDVRITINAAGYRDRDFARDKGNAFRILGLGDSFTFGSGVEEEEIYLSRLEQSLAADGGRFDVLNLGAGGRGLSDEAMVLETDGPDLAPDLVILGLFLGNDIRDVMLGWDRFEVNGGFRSWKDGILERWKRPLTPGLILEPTGGPPPRRNRSSTALPIPFKAFFKERLHLYTFVQKRYDMLRARLTPRGTGPTKSFTIFNMEALMIDPYPVELEEGWAQSSAVLARIQGWCEMHGARFVVAAVPIPAQVDPEIWDQALATYGLDPAHLDRTKPQRRLAEIGKHHGIPVIDLLPAFERARDASSERLYYERDIHWTPRGHLVAAEEILRVLRADDLLSPASPPRRPASD
jgi:hypothetical protein